MPDAQDFVKAVSSFNLDTAFPNMEAHAYDWRVDKYEPNRVWFTIRNTGTHTGPLKFLGRTIQPTGKVRCRSTPCYGSCDRQKCGLSWENLLPIPYLLSQLETHNCADSVLPAGGAGGAGVPVVHI